MDRRRQTEERQEKDSILILYRKMILGRDRRRGIFWTVVSSGQDFEYVKNGPFVYYSK